MESQENETSKVFEVDAIKSVDESEALSSASISSALICRFAFSCDL